MDTVIEKTLRRRGHSSTTQRQICTYLEFILTESHRMNTKLLTLLLVVAVVGLLAANTAEAKFEKFEYEHSGKRYKCKCKVKQIKTVHVEHHYKDEHHIDYHVNPPKYEEYNHY